MVDGHPGPSLSAELERRHRCAEAMRLFAKGLMTLDEATRECRMAWNEFNKKMEE